jgi:hypothetical protein
VRCRDGRSWRSCEVVRRQFVQRLPCRCSRHWRRHTAGAALRRLGRERGCAGDTGGRETGAKVLMARPSMQLRPRQRSSGRGAGEHLQRRRRAGAEAQRNKGATQRLAAGPEPPAVDRGAHVTCRRSRFPTGGAPAACPKRRALPTRRASEVRSEAADAQAPAAGCADSFRPTTIPRLLHPRPALSHCSHLRIHPSHSLLLLCFLLSPAAHLRHSLSSHPP